MKKLKQKDETNKTKSKENGAVEDDDDEEDETNLVENEEEEFESDTEEDDYDDDDDESEVEDEDENDDSENDEEEESGEDDENVLYKLNESFRSSQINESEKDEVAPVDVEVVENKSESRKLRSRFPRVHSEYEFQKGDNKNRKS